MEEKEFDIDVWYAEFMAILDKMFSNIKGGS